MWYWYRYLFLVYFTFLSSQEQAGSGFGRPFLMRIRIRNTDLKNVMLYDYLQQFGAKMLATLREPKRLIKTPVPQKFQRHRICNTAKQNDVSF